MYHRRLSCVLMVACILGLGGGLAAAEAQMVRCAGTVVDDDGLPVSGAGVTVYEMLSDGLAGNFTLKKAGELVTGGDGAYAFAVVPRPARGTLFVWSYVVAAKEGLAPGWAIWDMREDLGATITLGEPARAEGVVVDEAGRPIADAHVCANLLRTRQMAAGEEKKEWLSGLALPSRLQTRTDSRGRFVFNGLPRDAAIAYLIAAAGKATIYTHDANPAERPPIFPGQTGVWFVLPREGRIAGRILDADASGSVAKARFAVVPTSSGLMYYRLVCTTDEAGAFSVEGLKAGRYLIRGERLPPTYVEVTSGETAQVTIRANRAWYGRMLFDDGVPVGQRETWPGAKVSISLRRADGQLVWDVGAIDEQGILTLYLSDEQMQQLRAGEMSIRIGVPVGLRHGLQHSLAQPFPAGLLSRDRSQAGTLTLPPMWRDPISLVGRPLPSVATLNGGLEPALESGRLLLCFFDSGQRPSRHCLAQLTERAKTLSAEGINIAAIQTTAMEDVAWRQWLAKQSTSFPIVRAECDFETIRFSWAIRALPWLILTDRNHVIIAEGVALDALNQRPEDAGSASDTAPAAGEVAEPNAADLVRQVRASEDWLHRISSLQFRVEGMWSHPPESIAARRAELQRQDPNREPDPRYDASLRPSAGDSLEYAIDFAKQHLRYVQNTATEDYFLQIWDGEQLVCHSIRTDGYEEYSLGLSKEPLDRIFGSLSWPRAQPHSFWWAPQDVEQLIGMYGRPQDFRSTGRAEYRGVPCYVLEFDPPDTQGQTVRWYIGRKDRLLYGRTGELFEHWTVDYREIAPNCWIPMTQGYSITRFDQDRKKRYVRLQRDARIVDVRINEELPEALFQMEWKEGIYVVDRRSGETVVSKYVDVPPSLLGRPLPDVASLRTALTAEQVAGRKILLCFWDMNQRPSRRCLTELAAGYERLRYQDVVVAAVDMSEADRESLDRWKQEQGIPYPLGRADGDLRKVRQTWGVRSLPWLILTDTNHVVIAEGFGVGELEGKLDFAAAGR